MTNLYEYLRDNSYPGRGIIIGKTPDGKNAVVVYFIMGRSVNSRNRVFVLEGENMKTQAHDENFLTDPSLVIYYPVRKNGNKIIVTNGDQTDTINDFLNSGKSFKEALQTREFEPDAPNYTPRISGILTFENGGFSYEMSILKNNGEGKACNRYYYEYDMPLDGEARFIHTYETDGEPLPSFIGEPKLVKLKNDINETAEKIWQNLNEENKVSLYVKYIPLDGGETKYIIINKNI